ncbi:TPA: hypothetical protein QH850_000236 [Enterobacter chengduensis]|nr:hypothetical protein [Enterobacter chengduensis]
MRSKKKIVLLLSAVMLLGACFSAESKDLPLNGKKIITHDYSCTGVSIGDKSTMTVGETPGEASVVAVGEGMPKPVGATLKAMDDQTRVTRMYKTGDEKDGEMILEVASLTKLATITMLHFADNEAYTAKVCYEEE